MKIELTYSEQTIKSKYNTIGSEPVLVRCEDGEAYVCKYSVGTLTDFLFYELLAASFLKMWALAAPDFKFVKVKPNHVDESLGIKTAYFEKVCFGSKYGKSYVDVSRAFFRHPKRFYKAFEKRKKEFLKICLFDIWTGHSDRTEDNFNLMYDSENIGHFIPIDNQAIFFNGNPFHLNNYDAKYEDSLLSSFLPLLLFSKKELTDTKILSELQSFFEENVLQCQQNLPKIVKNIPEEWQLDARLYQNAIANNLFNDKWIKKSWNDFVDFYHLTINKM